jgi:Na+/H+ antiporter NhaD/arsenite permease-like protein
MSWNDVIGLVALLFSAVCFYLFVKEAMRKAIPEQAVAEAEKRAQARNLDPAAIGALVKALADAFSKVGPAALGLIGAILFLLLSGEALNVFHLTDKKESVAGSKSKGKSDTDRGDGRGSSETANGSVDSANQSGNVQ